MNSVISRMNQLFGRWEHLVVEHEADDGDEDDDRNRNSVYIDDVHNKSIMTMTDRH